MRKNGGKPENGVNQKKNDPKTLPISPGYNLEYGFVALSHRLVTISSTWFSIIFNVFHVNYFRRVIHWNNDMQFVRFTYSLVFSIIIFKYHSKGEGGRHIWLSILENILKKINENLFFFIKLNTSNKWAHSCRWRYHIILLISFNWFSNKNTQFYIHVNLNLKARQMFSLCINELRPI